MICYAERLPLVPTWLLRLFEADAPLGPPYDAVATAMALPGRVQIEGLLSQVPFGREHLAQIIDALWREGLRGSLTWERSKLVGSEWVRVPIRSIIRPYGA